MRVNVDKVLERDQKLSELDDRAGKLCVDACMWQCMACLSTYWQGLYSGQFVWWL